MRIPRAIKLLAAWAAGLTLAVTGSSVAAGPTVPPAGAGEPTTPPGMITLLPDAGWCWFEDARVRFSGDGTHLYLSGVDGTSSPTQGGVDVLDLTMATGERSIATVGRAEPDDHNSASIWVGPTGEVTTSWSRHREDRFLNLARRRTDGTWLILPPVATSSGSTYSNLLDGADAKGSRLLYDFYRGFRLDPNVLASPDQGRTWVDLGRVLRDPQDTTDQRPYVQYRATGDRIDLIATEGHPREAVTSVYHGYIQGGSVYSSAGQRLGALGAAIPVTALTRVWTSDGTDRGWTVDLTTDPVTHRPVVAWSVKLSIDDHRYWVGRWDGTAWQTEEIAHGGRRLVVGEDDYTGLLAIDPRDTNHVVISTDAHPVTGDPLISASDGQRHWELWNGVRGVGGDWAWSPLTVDSSVDNIRPVYATGPGAATALTWLRGTYPTYSSYDLDVVGILSTTAGATVPAKPATSVHPVTVLPPAPPGPAGRITTGDFDGHPADDLLLVRPGSGAEQMVLGDDQGHGTPIAAPSVNGSYTAVPGDFDGDGRTDIYWYAPGPAPDTLWRTTGVAGHVTVPSPAQVTGTYTPIPGDYDGDGRTDIYWYAPGAASDRLWTATAHGGFTSTTPRQVTGTYTPIPGDYDGDGDTDILWYAPGSAPDSIWIATGHGAFTTRARQITGAFTPIPGDFDGDGDTDVFWYAPGAATDRLWTAATGAAFTSSTPRQVTGTYTPVPADIDGNGRTDILWYAPGAATDQQWLSMTVPFDRTRPATPQL